MRPYFSLPHVYVVEIKKLSLKNILFNLYADKKLLMILIYSIQSKIIISELRYNYCKTNSCNFNTFANFIAEDLKQKKVQSDKS